MSDWELVQGPQEHDNQYSDWSVVAHAPLSQQPHQQEGLGKSLAMAVPRIGEDIYRGGMEFIKDIPGYWKSAQTEIPGAFETLKAHPGHALMQALAGSQELINNLAQTPKGIFSYGENRLNLIPHGISDFVAKHSPEDTSEAIHHLFGEPQYAGEKLIRGAGRNALNALVLGKAASTLNPMKFTYKNLAKDVIDTRKNNINKYGNLYNDLWRDAEQKGFGDALYNVDIDMPTLKKYSGDRSIKGVVDFNENPTLENAHAAKSDLLRIQRDLNKLTTLRTSESQQLHAANSAINSIKENMFKDPLGHIDKNMLDRYERTQTGYKNEVVPYKNKAINDFLRNETSEEELINSLSKRAFARKRGKFHPRIGIKNKIKKHPYLTGAGLGGLGTLLYKEMFDDHPLEQ